MSMRTGLLLLLGMAGPVAGETGRTIIRDQKAAERLRGNDGMTLQWIGWDKRGTLAVRQPGATLLLKGRQRAASGPGLLTLDGEVTEIDARQFRFRGRIVISDTPDIGRNCVRDGDFTFAIRKLSYTGEPIDPATLDFIEETFHVPACSMYGTTEIGVVLVNFPGAEDFAVKPGSLGKAVPGQRLQVQNPDGTPTEPGVVGELMLWRRDRWETTKDLARIDEDGYFYHCGRADDVIISAGWTMSAVEIENTMLKHADVQECAVIGAPDATRGLVVKAFVVSSRAPSDAFVTELQTFTRERLAQHEFPRLVEFVAELPKTPAGKVHRKVLRDREAAAALALTN